MIPGKEGVVEGCGKVAALVDLGKEGQHQGVR
jgi:hypothetical protein